MIPKEEIHNILNTYSIGEYIDSDDFLKMMDVLKSHPDSKKKIGVGVEKIGIEKNDYGHRQFFILRTNNSKEHFSYIKCFSPRKKRTDFSKAMRLVVSDQIYDFKCKNFYKGMMCPIMGNELNYAEDIHIDHEDPTFDDLISDFINENKIDVNTIKYGKIVTGGVQR